jgi:hypothetical protein
MRAIIKIYKHTEVIMQPTMTTDEYGIIRYRLNGKHHREDGPAIIYADGSQEWYLNGEHHRLDGPAIIWPSGTQEWYRNGKHHREDGPAIITAKGNHAWCLNDNEYPFIDFCKQLKLSEEDITFLKLKFNTCIVV